jgi:hypothetical protein
VAALWLLAVRWSWRRPTRRRVLTRGVLVSAPAAVALAVRWLILAPGAGVGVLYRDFWTAVLAAVTVLVVVLLRHGPGGLVPALALAPGTAVLVSAAIWLRYLPEWQSAGAAAETYLLSPLAMLAAPLLVVALLAVLAEPGGTVAPGRRTRAGHQGRS